MKELALCLIVLWSNLSIAQGVNRNKIENNSLSDEDITQIMDQIVVAFKKFKTPMPSLGRKLSDPYFSYDVVKEVATEMRKNDKLKQFLDDGGFEITPALMNGFADSSVVGFEFKSENYQLCLPCAVGWNSFAWGYSEIPASQKKKLNNEMKCAKILGKISKHNHYSDHLNALVLPYTNESNEEGYVIYKSNDDSTNLVLPKDFQYSEKAPLKVICNDKKFTLHADGDKPVAYGLLNQDTPEKLKCSMAYNEKINEIVQDSYKKGLDLVYEKFLKAPHDKEDFLGLFDVCKDTSYGKIILGKIKDYKGSEVKEAKEGIAVSK